MKLIFIRHGDPDYVRDGLTEKGRVEAKALADMILIYYFLLSACFGYSLLIFFSIMRWKLKLLI